MQILLESMEKNKGFCWALDHALMANESLNHIKELMYLELLWTQVV